MYREIKFVNSWDLCLEINAEPRTINRTIKRIMDNPSYSGIILESTRKELNGREYREYLLDYRTLSTIKAISRRYEEQISNYMNKHYKRYKPTFVERIRETDITRELRIELYKAKVGNKKEAVKYIKDNYDRLVDYIPDKYKRKYSEDVYEETYYMIKEEYEEDEDEYEDYLFDD